MKIQTIDATIVTTDGPRCGSCKKTATKLVRMNPNFAKGAKAPATLKLCRTCKKARTRK